MFAHNAQQKETLNKQEACRKEVIHPERGRKTGRTSGKSSRCTSRRSSLDILAEEPLIINPHMVTAEENEEESLLDRSFSDEENEENKLSSSYNECKHQLANSFRNHKFSRKEESESSFSYVEERESRRKKRSREEPVSGDKCKDNQLRSREHSLDERRLLKEDEVRIRKRSHSQLRPCSKGSSLNGSVNDLDKGSMYPSLPTSRRTSWSGYKAATWSRRSSLAGNEFFKMDDEMVPMVRGGTTFMMPKTITHHVPVVPIIKSDLYEEKEVLKTYSLDSDEFQIYKTVEVYLYDKLKSAIMNICGQQRKDINWKTRRGRLAAKLFKILHGQDLSPEEFIKLLKEELSEEDLAKLNLSPESWTEMKEMLKQGYTINDILNKYMKSEKVLEEEERQAINKFRELIKGKDLTDEEIFELMQKELGGDAKERMEELLKSGMSMKDVIDTIMNNKPKEESSFSKKMKMLIGDKDLSEEELFNLLQDKLGSDSKKKMEEMLAAGYTMQEVIEHFMEKGKTQEEENKEFAEKMNNLLDGKNLSNEEILEMMKFELGDEDKAKMEEMLKSGCSMQEVIDHFMKRPTKPEESAFSKKMKKLIGDKDLSEEEVFKLLKKKLGKESCKKMEEMLKQGFSLKDIIEHFMEHGKTQDEEDKEFTQKMKNLIDGKNMTPEETLTLLKQNLNDKDKQKMEEMLKSGKSIQEVIDFFMNPENQKSKLAKKMGKLTGDADLSEQDILNLMKEEMGAESKEKMEEMLRQGYSLQEVIDHFMEHGKSQEEEEKDLSEKLHKLFDGEKNLSQAEIFESLKNQLCAADKAKLEELLKEGFTKKEIIDFFMERGEGNPEVSTFAKKMHGVMKGKSLTEEEIINFMKHFLNMDGRELLEDMINKGTPLQDIIDHFMKHGKERVESEFERKINLLMKGRDLSPEQIVNLMMGYLDEEGKAKMAELLKSGMPIQDVINYMMEKGVGRELTDLEKEIQQLCEGKNLTQEELFEVMKDKLGTEWHKNRIEKMLEEGYTFLEIIDHLWMKGSLGAGTQAEMEEMLKKGYTIQEVLMFMMNHGKTQEEEDLLMAKNMQTLISNENISNSEILEAMSDKLSDADKKLMEEMLKNGSSLEEVMEHFSNRGKNEDEVDFATKIQNLMGDKQLDEEEMCKLIKCQLGSQGQKEMEEMLKSGMSMKEVIEHFMEKGKTQEEEDKQFSEKIHELIGDRTDLSQSEILDVMKNDLDEEGRAKMEEMLKNGSTMQEIIDHFMNCERTLSEESKNKLADKLHNLIDGKNLSQPEILDLIKSELSAADKEKMEEMLKSGCSMQEVIDEFMNRGKPTEESEFTKKMKKLQSDKNMSQDELFEAMKGELGDKSKAEMEEMLKQGFSMEEVMNHFMEHGKTQKDEDKEFANKMHNLIDGKNMSPSEIINLMKNEMSDEDKAKMERMLESGCTMQDVIDEFMNRGKPSEESEFTKKMKKLKGDKNMSQDELFEAMKSELGDKSRAEMEEMLKQGFSMDEVMNHFMEHGKTQEDEDKEFTKKIHNLTDGKNMSPCEIINLMKNEMSDEDKAKMERMLESGCTMQEVIDEFMNRGKPTDEKKKELANKLHNLIDGQNLSETEILNVIKGELNETDKKKMEEMLKQGYSMQDVINEFMNPKPTEENEISKKLKKLAGGKQLSEKEIFDMMKDELGDESRAKMEEMLKQGFTMQEINNYMMEHGKTKREEQNEFSEKIRKKMEGKDMSESEILDLLRQELGEDKGAQINAMLRDGMSMQDVIDHFLKESKEEDEPQPKKLTQEDKMRLMKGQLGSDGSEAQDILDKLGKEGYSMDQVIVDSFSNTRLKFPDEDQGLANRNRDVNNLVSPDEKEGIPYMHPAIRDCTFIIFFEKILEIVGNKGLTHYEIMDLIRYRIGGSYAEEFEKQRKSCLKLQEIVDYFLKKDEELREEARKLMILTLPKSVFIVRRILLRMSEDEVRNEICRDL